MPGSASLRAARSPVTTSHADFDAYLRSGDTVRAASWLVEALADDVYGLCRAMVRDDVLAEDLAQDAFSRALAGLGGFRGEASPRTWLLAIARNRCLDHLRRSRIDPTDADEAWEEHADPEPVAVDVLLSRRDLQRGLDVLSETERALVVLHHGHGLRYGELAAAFGIKEGTARMRVKRALGKVRAELERPAPMAQAFDAMALDEAEEEAVPRSPQRARSGVFGGLRRKRSALPEADEAPVPASAPAPAPPAPRGGGGAPVAGGLELEDVAAGSAELEQITSAASSAGLSAPALHQGASRRLRQRLQQLVAALR